MLKPKNVNSTNPQYHFWGHTSHISCHSGVWRTLFRIQERFWWPSIKKDVREYVAACTKDIKQWLNNNCAPFRSPATSPCATAPLVRHLPGLPPFPHVLLKQRKRIWLAARGGYCPSCPSNKITSDHDTALWHRKEPIEMPLLEATMVDTAPTRCHF